MDPGAAALIDFAAKTLTPHARVLVLGGPASPPPRLAAQRVTVAPEEDVLAFVESHAHEPVDAIVAIWPTRVAPLIPLLSSMKLALHDEGRAFVMDLVWQTAPTPSLMKAFAPPAGREKVRPVEGFEMQVDHAGFDVLERIDLPRDAWVDALSPEQREAVHADARGAAMLSVWALRPRGP